ncbi:MAG: TSUP family transporter, partial [Deltaproteobacteria bacterium]|nr:TSUP family transporter [Deltaproteobacteria bacterium]
MELAVLCVAAFLASILSAVVGMAGGIVLLTVMLLYFEPLIAIPLHGVIQLASNGSRSFIQRAHVRWDLVWRYGILLLPMAYAG